MFTLFIVIFSAVLLAIIAFNRPMWIVKFVLGTFVLFAILHVMRLLSEMP